jgi:hypothetical protein
MVNVISPIRAMNFCIAQTVAILRLSGPRERNEEQFAGKTPN